MTPWAAARQASLSFTNSRSLLKLMSIETVKWSNHLILCYTLLLPSIFPSIRVFSNESVFCIKWPKCWSFIFNISPPNEYSGLISFRMDWLDLLEAAQGTLKSLLQLHSSKVLILQTVQVPASSPPRAQLLRIFSTFSRDALPTAVCLIGRLQTRMTLRMLHRFLAAAFICLRDARDAKRKQRPLLQAKTAYGWPIKSLPSSVRKWPRPMPMPRLRRQDCALSSLCLCWNNYYRIKR